MPLPLVAAARGGWSRGESLLPSWGACMASSLCEDEGGKSMNWMDWVGLLLALLVLGRSGNLVVFFFDIL
jgi:hypothetical protein